MASGQDAPPTLVVTGRFRREREGISWIRVDIQFKLWYVDFSVWRRRIRKVAADGNELGPLPYQTVLSRFCELQEKEEGSY